MARWFCEPFTQRSSRSERSGRELTTENRFNLQIYRGTVRSGEGVLFLSTLSYA